ncbi:hAT transposon superfamily protein [Zea mays]|uniref:HAT transposon superfamily protein n=1 Tax=Zea mays TaxID=4577 RepID=A0A1D6MUJ2_MAIZE|nr:hAT transposon superfamily protein [Zea mays]
MAASAAASSMVAPSANPSDVVRSQYPMATSASTDASSSEDEDEKKPLWRYAEILERTGTGFGGNVRIRCTLCNHVWNGSYSRVKAHMLKIPGFGVKFCRVVTVHVLEQLKAEVAAASVVANRTLPRDIPLPVEGNEKRKRRGVSAIESSFNLDVRRQLDELIARMFYTGGLPFNLARNPYFRKAFMFATNNPIGGYVPPSYNKLRTTLLVQERTHVERMLQPLKETWSSKGVSIVSDGCEVIGDASMIKNFIMNHSMRLSMFNEQSNLKFLAIADTRFASAIVMLKRFIAIKDALSVMVVSEKWSAYREDNPRQAQFVKEKIVNDMWWDKVRYFLSFTEPIYTMIRAANTDKACLHLIYEMWDTMIEKVKSVIYRHEMKETHEESIFYSAVHDILVSRWTKSNTPLHCLAHSLNPKYYTDAWINEVPNRQAPHNDEEISEMRNTCFRRYFSGEELKKIKLQYANFSLFGNGFNSFDSLEDRSYMEPKMWWGIHGHSATELKKLALKLLGQPASSSCAERNWSTYGLIHSSLRNRLNPGRAEDLVFTHQNLRLLSRKSDEYRCGPSAMWDVGADTFEADFEGGADFLEQADLSLNEPELEERLFEDLEALGLTEDAE